MGATFVEGIKNWAADRFDFSSFRDFWSLHQQDLKGLSQAQVNYMNKSFQTTTMFGKREGSETQLKEFDKASNALREEIKQHVFGKNYNEQRDKETLDAYTKGMTIQLESLMGNKTQGYATKVMDFNRTFKIKEATGQKIS